MILMPVWQVLWPSPPIRGQNWKWLTNQRPGNWWPWTLSHSLDMIASANIYHPQPQWADTLTPVTDNTQAQCGDNLDTWSGTLMTDSCISSSFTDCYLCSNLHLKCCPSLHWPWILKLIQLLVMVPGPGLGLSLQQHGSALDLSWDFSIFGSDRSSRSANPRPSSEKLSNF